VAENGSCMSVTTIANGKRTDTHVAHKLLAGGPNLLCEGRAEHHDLLVVRGDVEDFLHVAAHVCRGWKKVSQRSFRSRDTERREESRMEKGLEKNDDGREGNVISESRNGTAILQ
jgi:hypothetical protein